MSTNLEVALQNIGKMLMTDIQMGLSYKWSKDFAYSEIIEAHENIKNELKELIGDVVSLSVESLELLGFTRWSDDMPNLLLIPLYLYDLIPDGIELTDTYGTKHIKGVDRIDLDVRLGCIAYGINVE